MICDNCQMGADVAAEYREDDRRWNESRGFTLAEGNVTGVNPDHPSGWLRIRLRRALAVHCRRQDTRCDCQCQIPELKNDRQAIELLSNPRVEVTDA